MATVFVVLIGLGVIFSIILLLVADVALMMYIYRFLEEAFAAHRLLGLSIVFPPVAGVVLWGVGRLLGDWLDLPGLASLGLIAGQALLVIPPLVCIILPITMWGRFRRVVGGMAASIAYLVAWVVLMINVVGPSAYGRL